MSTGDQAGAGQPVAKALLTHPAMTALMIELFLFY
jgi:hypothetical protein